MKCQQCRDTGLIIIRNHCGSGRFGFSVTSHLCWYCRCLSCAKQRKDCDCTENSGALEGAYLFIS